MEKLSDLQIGERFTYKDIEWIALDCIDGNILAMTAKVWQEMPFDTDEYNDWNKSSMRRVLNSDFLDKLDRKHLIKFEPNVTADNGDTLYAEKVEPDYVCILSCDQYRKYRKIVPLFDEWMWTCTPWTCLPTSSYANLVRFVLTTGSISGNYADYSYGVAPLVLLSSEHLKLCRQAHLVECDE